MFKEFFMDNLNERVNPFKDGPLDIRLKIHCCGKSSSRNDVRGIFNNENELRAAYKKQFLKMIDMFWEPYYPFNMRVDVDVLGHSDESEIARSVDNMIFYYHKKLKKQYWPNKEELKNRNQNRPWTIWIHNPKTGQRQKIEKSETIPKGWEKEKG